MQRYNDGHFGHVRCLEPEFLARDSKELGNSLLIRGSQTGSRVITGEFFEASERAICRNSRWVRVRPVGPGHRLCSGTPEVLRSAQSALAAHMLFGFFCVTDYTQQRECLAGIPTQRLGNSGNPSQRIVYRRQRLRRLQCADGGGWCRRSTWWWERRRSRWRDEHHRWRRTVRLQHFAGSRCIVGVAEADYSVPGWSVISLRFASHPEAWRFACDLHRRGPYRSPDIEKGAIDCAGLSAQAGADSAGGEPTATTGGGSSLSDNALFEPDLGRVWRSEYGDIHWSAGWYGVKNKTLSITSRKWDASLGAYVVEGALGQSEQA